MPRPATSYNNSYMNRKYFRPIISQLAGQLLLCILPLILIGCGKTETEGDKTLRIGGLGGKPGPINQIITNSTISVNLADLVFSALVRINERMMPEPDLAESWQVSQDGLTYTFNLRKGVRFHNNVELTAEDCAFTYNAILDPATNSPWRENYTMIKDIKAEDKHTFVVRLNESQASFINLMNFPIHPHTNPDNKTSYYKAEKESEGRKIYYNDSDRIGVGVNPIGTGPFRFVERTKDDTIILERNQDYYDPDTKGIGVGVNRIEARGYDTFAQYFSAFMKGETDMIQFLNTEQFETLARDPAFRAYSFPSIYTYMIDYNPEHPLFKDKKVRQALAHAINIPEIINKIESGLGVQSTGPFIPGAWFSCPVRSAHERENNPLIKSDSSLSDASNGADPFISPLEYNPALALELLKEAGWDNNPSLNGIPSEGPTPFSKGESGNSPLIKGDSGGCQEFRFTLLVDPKERVTETIAKIVYQDLYKIGVRCEIKTYDHSHQDKELIKEAGAAVISIMMTPADLEPKWTSDKHARAGKLWPYVDHEIDALFEQANATQDINQRQELYHKLHRLVYAEQSGTFLYCLPNLGAVNARFGNTDKLFSANMPFYTIKDWNISHEDTKTQR